jgi:hypothetical protein
VINWMLEEEGVEDVACTVDDMEVGGNGVRDSEGWTAKRYLGDLATWLWLDGPSADARDREREYA